MATEKMKTILVKSAKYGFFIGVLYGVAIITYSYVVAPSMPGRTEIAVQIGIILGISLKATFIGIVIGLCGCAVYKIRNHMLNRRPT